MSSEPVIRLTDVWKKYSKRPIMHNSLREEIVSMFSGRKRGNGLEEGEFWALQDISLNIEKGECIGLYGPNGSGKSTILKLVSNVTYPTRGEVVVKGRVAPLIELGAGMHPDLTGIENIYMNGTILGLTIRELKYKINEITEFSGLSDFINVPVKKYSSGMYLRLAFSIAVHSPSETFLFDEVLAVGDENFQARCINKIKEIKNLGNTIIIVSHDYAAMDRICDRIVQINLGRMVDQERG